LPAGEQIIDSSYSSNAIISLLLVESPIVSGTLYLYQLSNLSTCVENLKVSNIVEGLNITISVTSI